MKKFITWSALLLLCAQMSGCIVVPDQPGYYPGPHGHGCGYYHDCWR